jgi:hypothetical protein
VDDAPERAAQWGIDTGYVAVRPDAWPDAEDAGVREGLPVAAVARDQLQFSVAELSTHDNQRVTKALNDGLQAALTGAKTPEQAMKDAQAEAARILGRRGEARAELKPAMSRSAIHGWLLLLPAAALLALFTHWPVFGTIWDSFHATPKGSRPRPSWGSRTTR